MLLVRVNGDKGLDQIVLFDLGRVSFLTVRKSVPLQNVKMRSGCAAEVQKSSVSEK